MAEFINVTIKRKSSRKAGFEVEQAEDGFYYITKVPPKCTKIGIGDRVLEINGTMHDDFKSQNNANALVDSFRLEVLPFDTAADDDDDQSDQSEDEYEELDRSESKTNDRHKLASMVHGNVNNSKRSNSMGTESEGNEDDSDYEEDWNDGGETKSEESQSDDESFDSDESDIPAERESDVENASDDENELERVQSWDRPYVSNYNPNDRFMISVNKEAQCYDGKLGIDLVEFQEGEIYVSEVNQGPFYETALNRGDKIISINGRKNLNCVGTAMEILHSHVKSTLFVLRPKKNDEGYNWVNDNT